MKKYILFFIIKNIKGVSLDQIKKKKVVLYIMTKINNYKRKTIYLFKTTYTSFIALQMFNYVYN